MNNERDKNSEVGTGETDEKRKFIRYCKKSYKFYK